jgi:hypothetical protein
MSHRPIIRIGNLIIDASTITAAHPTGGERLGIVVHFGGIVHVVHCLSDEQLTDWLNLITTAMNLDTASPALAE